MELNYYLLSLGFIPLLASRGALPILTAALVSGLGEKWQLFSDYAGIELIYGLPEWLSSPTGLFLLVIMSFVEHGYQKSPEARELIASSESHLKGIFAFFLCFFMVGGQVDTLVQHVENEGLSTNFGGFLSLEYIWAFGVGLLTWFLAFIRKSVYTLYSELDPNDDLAIQKLLIYMEAGLGIAGPLIFIAFPALAAIVAVISIVSLKLIQIRFERLEEQQKAPCPNCKTLNHLSALGCSNCDHVATQPRDVGLFGQAQETVVSDYDAHRFAMIERKRCSHCGERCKLKGLNIQCERCQRPFFNGPDDGKRYLRYISAKLPKTLIISGLCSLIPVIGLIPGVIYYRLNLVGGLRAYLPLGATFINRWLVRILCLFVLFFQTMPIIGLVSIPIMCLINYSIYGLSMRRRVSSIRSH
ncbi:MAG: hypothetical protein COA42_16545 [Alteromonadaceae bacterium]|nr:MAG: hypothetical protein COA42_16545 [Alteromonadaceae bacterium]